MARLRDDGRKVMLTRVRTDVADAVTKAAYSLGLNISDFLAAAAVEKLDRTKDAVTLSHSAHEAEIARLSLQADSFTGEISGKARGRNG